jgi:hypothetical protein
MKIVALVGFWIFGAALTALGAVMYGGIFAIPIGLAALVMGTRQILKEDW